MNKKGTFLVFEGIDGSGKTTQISLLKKRIEATGTKCFETKEPTDGPIGSLLRQCLTGRIEMSEQALAALFAADRLDHLQNKTDGLCNKIEDGISVISDRYYLSSYAYQSVCVPQEWVINANALATDILRPDCHIFIDVDPEETIHRMAKGRFHTELFETKERLTSVRNEYYKLFERFKDTEHIVIIDGNQSIEKISDDIWSFVHSYFDTL